MPKRVFHKITSLPIITHSAGAAGAVLAFGWVKSKLDASYAASNHPVDYATGQTGFSGSTLKEYYAIMQEAGTLDIYARTQLIDFVFILCMIVMGLFFCTLLARFSRDQSLGRRLGLFAGMSVVLGAIFDIGENSISFVMLNNPNGFADWIAIIYSGFAVVKFAFIALGLLALIASLLCATIGRAFSKPSIG